MKVGTDGVLAGAWARVEPWQERLLDIGAGTGLIALMLAQRTEEWGAEIDAVEIDGGSFAQAEANISGSPWSGRMRAHHSSVQDFAGDTDRRYYHIVTNPPYFVNSLLPPDQGRTLARHASSLGSGELLGCMDALLAPSGIFSLIIPADGWKEFALSARGKGFHMRRRTAVFSVPDAPAKRMLMEFSRTGGGCEETELVIEAGAPRDFTPEYRELTKDFYLKF